MLCLFPSMRNTGASQGGATADASTSKVYLASASSHVRAHSTCGVYVASALWAAFRVHNIMTMLAVC